MPMAVFATRTPANSASAGRPAARMRTRNTNRMRLKTVRVFSRTMLPTLRLLGGGPGRYARWLAGSGYTVRHRDLVPLHIEQLAADIEEDDLDIDCAVADARDLDLPDECADAVLLLGPLYHLPDRTDRLRALA